MVPVFEGHNFLGLTETALYLAALSFPESLPPFPSLFEGRWFSDVQSEYWLQSIFPLLPALFLVNKALFHYERRKLGLPDDTQEIHTIWNAESNSIANFLFSFFHIKNEMF